MKSYIVQAIVALFALAALFVCGGQALGASAGELIGKPFPAGTTSSSSGGPGAPSYTYDNNLATSWSTYLTLGSGDWLRINLPAPQYIAGYQFVTSSLEGAGNQIINAYYTTNDNIQIGTKTIAADSNDSSSIISVSPGTYTKLMFGFYGTVHTTVKEIRIIPLPTPTVTAVPGDSQAQLSWNPITVGDVAGFHIYQGDTLIGTVSSSTYSYTATSLQNDVPYTFSVAAFDSGNAESLKAAVSVTPLDKTAPSAPTGFTATAGDGQVTLNWTANTENDVAKYKVTWKVQDSSDPVQSADVITGTSYTLTGLTNGTAYEFTVIAVDTSGNESSPGSSLVATPRDSVAPSAPTDLTSTSGDGQVTLNWTANTENDIAKYKVTWKAQDSSDPVQSADVIAGTSYTLTGLTNGTAYEFTVIAVDTSGNESSPGSSLVATPRDSVAPSAPTDLTSTSGDGQVTLNWTANTENDVAKYKVTWKVQDSSDPVQSADVITGTSYTITGLTNGTAYEFTVVAVDTSGNESSPGSSLVATPRDSVAPSAPAGLTSTSGDGQVTLNWTANTENDVAKYKVTWKIQDSSDPVQSADVITGTSYTLTGLTNGTAYEFTLIAVDTSGNESSPGSSLVATPRDSVAPSAPTGLTSTSGDGQVTLNWTANTENDVAKYKVTWKAQDSSDSIPSADVITGTSYTLTGLTNGTAYEFTVIAVDTSGNESSPGSSLVATPRDSVAPSVPTGVTATAGDGQVKLEWTANTENDVAKYKVTWKAQDSSDSIPNADVITGTSYTLTGLTNGTAYEFTVIAVDTSGNESSPGSSLVATPRDSVAPSAPTDLTSTSGDGQVKLEWTANTENDVAKYKVTWKVQDSSEPVQSADVITGTSYTLTDLTNGTAYEFTVITVDTSGNESSPGSSLVATPRDSVAPSVPTGVTATAGDGQVKLEWTANTENDVAKYKVTWKVQDSSEPVQSADVITGTSYTLTDLTNGTAYEFTVAAVDTSGNESSPGSSLVATPPLSMPTGLTATAGNGYVELKWMASTENVDHYKIYWHVPNGQTSSATVSASTYAVTGLANGTAYTFTVVAVDPANHESPPSLSLTATPIDTAPSAPKGFTATAGDGEVTLNWNPNPESDIANYKVYWFTQDTADSPNIVSVDNSTYSYTVTGITYGTTYTFTLAAIDAAGNESPKSAPQIVTPQQQFLQVLLNSSMLSIGQNMEIQIKFRIADGSLVDVSESAAVSITASSDTAQPIVEIAHNPLSLIPKAAGYVTLTVQYEGYTVEVPIFVNYREWVASKVNPTGGPASMHNVVSYLSNGNNDVTGDGIFDKTDVRALLELIEPVFVHAASD